ncbi:uncharacterized protein B0H18DRAFT_831889, partial [Fomitopsis serialis]|uniref:uncharacterized protein n=1 Tax=Fomitopsis serialis TaxID=139415 RepID=UPI0020079671
QLHIDFAKKVWQASNHMDQFPQMVKWISWREKMALYKMFQECCEEEEVEDPEEEEDGRTVDAIRSVPASGHQGRKSHFDTAIVLETEEAEAMRVKGTRAGHVKVIFTLPKTLSPSHGGSPAPLWWPQGPLAYVEWY